jgi:hypothetical protein
MVDKWTLYYHKEKSRSLAEFLRDLSALSSFTGVAIEALPNNNKGKEFARLSRSVRKLLFFGHPDVILAYDNGIEPEKAVFAWEITDAKPATDHWMQRFPSLVGACELGVPSIFILRFESRTPSWSANLESEFFYAYDRVMEIEQIPIYLADWLPDNTGAFAFDSTYPDVPDRNSDSMVDTIEFLNKVIDYSIHGKDFHKLIKERLLVDLRNKLKVKIHRVPKPEDFNRLTVASATGYSEWSDVLSYIHSRTSFPLSHVPARLMLRKKSLIFVPRPQFHKGIRVLKESLLSRIIKRNGNPYNGMPLAFDFMFCRLGPSTYERDVNMIVDMSEISYSDFISFAKNIHNSSPIASSALPASDQISRLSLHLTEGYTHEIKDFIRQYCYAADLIILSDFIIPFE